RAHPSLMSSNHSASPTRPLHRSPPIAHHVVTHLLDSKVDPERYVQDSVQRRHLTATVPGGAATGEAVISREGLALKPT
ncbi:hypothetical protein, partial [Streptomyces cinereoruber]|uniref:hypothetical protein n=1 Tax=Streptomyces cinereoruber TaxID=67260 RepID=UPI00363782A4